MTPLDGAMLFVYLLAATVIIGANVMLLLAGASAALSLVLPGACASIISRKA